MSRARSRTENTLRHAAAAALSAAARDTFARRFRASPAQLLWRSACGLLAAMHVAPLVRVTPQLLDGPTPALVATWAVLALLIGVLAAKAAGLALLPRQLRFRRAQLVAFVAAAAVFHGDVVLSKDQAPTTVAILVTTGAAAAAIPLLRRVREHLTGFGRSYRDLFPALLWGRSSCERALRPVCFVGLSAAHPRGPPRSPFRP